MPLGTLVVDADGHVEEDLDWIVEALPPRLRPLAPRSERSPDGSVVTLIEGRPWKPRFAFPRGADTHRSAGGQVRQAGRDPAKRLEVLDSEGIDVAVLYPSLGLMFGLYRDPEVAAAMCAACNDWMAEYCSADPDRLMGMALLPQQDPSLAAAELARCVECHRFVGGVMRPNRIGGRTVDDLAFEQLWSTACSLNVPVVLHEAYVGGIETVGEDRVGSYAGAHVVSHPLEQMVAMLGLCLSGTFTRHPDLRIGFFEAGCGWAPYWVERIEEHFELSSGDYLGGDPRGVLQRSCWLTFEVDEACLQATAELGWGERLCFASDFPHFDAPFPGAVDALRKRSLGQELETKLLGSNALSFYQGRLARTWG